MPFRIRFHHSPTSPRFLGGSVALSFLLLLTLTACHRTPAPSNAAPSPLSGAATDTLPDEGGYVGNGACASCHPGEFQQHRGSRHALTMRAADTASLSGMAPAPGTIPLAGYALATPSGRLTLTRAIAPVGPVPLDLALGSGKVGITFVSLQSKDTLLEARMSYFPAGRQWDFTPGQEEKSGDDTVFGRIHRGDGDAGRCVRCHSVTLPAGDIRPAPRFYGVGCESCHGAGKAHIEAMHKGDMAHVSMQNLGKLPSGQLNDLCGKCHRSLKDVDLDTPAGSLTHRFQPYALVRSRCRNSEGGVLSCLTCHSAHTDVNPDLKKHEQECLQCHTTGQALPHSAGIPAVTGKACPVNPKSGCIPCHMRSRQSFPGLFWKPMVDHLIAIPSTQGPKRL